MKSSGVDKPEALPGVRVVVINVWSGARPSTRGVGTVVGSGATGLSQEDIVGTNPGVRVEVAGVCGGAGAAPRPHLTSTRTHTHKSPPWFAFWPSCLGPGLLITSLLHDTHRHGLQTSTEL